MANIEHRLNLASPENDILLNPRWPAKDYESLYSLAMRVQEERKLLGHVWVATSGTTSDSISGTKLVALSKQALKNSASSVNKHLQVTEADVWTQVLPHFHVGGLGIEVRASLVGAKVVNALTDQRWDVNHFYETIQTEKCTLAALVPTQVYDLVSNNFRAPATMRAIVVGGGAFEVDLYKKARELGWPVLPSYGMSETASQIATASVQSLGEGEFPEVRLLSHAEARTNVNGFLQVKATSLFTCYAQNQDGLARSWDPKVDGWFTTEDRGDVVDGCLHIQGRSRDYVKIGGEGTNIARLRTLLDKCALELNPAWPLKITLLDISSERLGAEVHCVSLLSLADTEEILELYSKRVLPFEKIRKIHFINEIPRSDLGKILWGELRRLI